MNSAIRRLGVRLILGAALSALGAAMLHAEDEAAVETAAREKLLAALKKPVDVEFVETPIEDVVRFLEDACQVQIEFDRRALTDVGVGTDNPVTLHVTGLSLATVLDLITRPVQLTWIIQNGVILLTDEETADNVKVTEIYDVADLVRPLWVAPITAPANASAGGAEANPIKAVTAAVNRATIESLVALLTAAVDADKGHIRPFQRSTLVSTLSDEQHRRLGDLLADLRVMRRDQRLALEANEVAAPKTREDSVSKALRSQTAFEFVDTPFSEVVGFIRDKHGINVVIDRRALSDAGIDIESPVTRLLKERSLAQALNSLLRDLELTYVSRGGCLVITTPEVAKNLRETQLYNVADLLTPPDMTPQEAYAAGYNIDELIAVITLAVNADNWETGGIAPFEGGVLAIKQSQAKHAEIDELFAKLRSVQRRQRELLKEAAEAKK